MNRFVMKVSLYEELMAEMDMVQPHLERCLALKARRKKDGASVLRTGDGLGCGSNATARNPSELATSAKALYEWFGPGTSRIRMLMTFQAQGGLIFVAFSHHKCAQAVRGQGNVMHAQIHSQEVTLEEFQDVERDIRWNRPGFTQEIARCSPKCAHMQNTQAIAARHAAGSGGMAVGCSVPMAVFEEKEEKA